MGFVYFLATEVGILSVIIAVRDVRPETSHGLKELLEGLAGILVISAYWAFGAKSASKPE